MPPSPSPRCSPVRELRVENSHKRGQSFESRFPRMAKDDDLVLFTEMQSRERDNFLLLSSDDFDESISKLRYYSDFNLGISIPARGESSDLLNADGEKNDYDWLLTPPDTPLFPSLEDDVPQPVNAPRGRARSQPISISRTSTYEKTPRTNRSSASPRRSSPSPRSTYSATYSRARPSSAPRSSPPPVLRPRSPSPRPSTPPTKPSPPAQRSLTPTLRRMSTGSTGPTLTGIRGTSPVKKNCGNSVSPKLRGWQTNLPGFSTEAPPNLRTFPTDRSASRVRGLSPASSTGRGFMPRYGRQSVSPSSSKSAVSSHNSEGDPFSSVSKPSAASSCEEDVESHAPLGVSPNAATRKYRDFAYSRTIGLSNKPSRSSSASSAPKRSFDLALRQTDHRKSPQNMFRPLLSSVPATTFYSGKTNTVHRPMFSRNSSLTTSSNASSDHGASVALYLEDSDHDQSDLGAEWDKTNVPDGQEEVFVFDKLDEISEDAGNDTCSAKCRSSIGTIDESVKNAAGKLVCSTGDDDGAVNKVVARQGSSTAEVVSKNGSTENLTICSSCGKPIVKSMDVQVVDVDVCQECCAPYGLVSSENTSAIEVSIQEIDSVDEARICSKCGKNLINVNLNVDVDVCQECYAMCEFPVSEESGTMQVANQEYHNGTMSHGRQSQMVMPELCESTSKIYSSQYEPVNVRGATHLSMDTGVDSLVTTECDKTGYLQELLKPHEMNAPESSGKYESSQSQKTSSLNGKVDDSEGTGIAVLLMNRSSSRKWPVVLGKVISATNILTVDHSYGGADSNVMKRNLARDGSSTSSSIDLGSTGLTDGHILRQLSCRKSETDSGRGESHISACPDLDKFSVTTPVCPQIESEELSSCILMDLENDGAENIIKDVQKPHKYFGDADLSLLKHTFTQQTAIAINVSSYNSISSSSSDLLLLTGQENSVEMCNTFIENIPGESCYSHGSSDKVPGTEAVAAIQNKPFTEDNYVLSSICCHDDVSYSATHSSPLVTSDQHNDIAGCQDTQNDYPSQVPNCSANFEEEISTILDNELLFSELKNIIPEDPSPEEPTKIVDPTRKHLQRSLTLEEATDTILFCSSIVHDIAYRAATIAAEKELIYESSHPPVAFMVSNVSNHKDLRKVSNKHTHSPRKVKRKKAETTDIMPSVELANNVNKSDFAASNVEVPQAVDSVKPPKLESKCNCAVM